MVVQVKKNLTKVNQAVQSQFQALFDAQKEKIVVEHKESGLVSRKNAMCFN